jgi:hypothetical protein
MSATATHSTVPEIRTAAPSLAATALGPIGLGLVLLVIAAAAGIGGGQVSRFWHAYLLGVTFITALSVGALFFVIAHHLAGGRWATVIRRLAELMASAIPYCAALFIPIAAHILLTDSGALYPWNDPTIVEGNELLEHKSGYLSSGFFVIRMAIYFGVYTLLARYFFGQSVAQDTSDPLARAKKMGARSGPAMILFALATNFAAFDWLMSLEPTWFSSIFGVYFFAGSAVAYVSFMILMLNFLQGRGVLTQSVTADHYHDKGKMLFGFIFFSGYIAFSQYMLIWYAAIPEETQWYAIRQVGPWVNFSWFLLFGHLLIPFLGTMSRTVRRNKKLIGFWAAWMLVMSVVNLFYVIMPQADGVEVGNMLKHPLPLPWLEALCVLGALAVFIGALIRNAAGKNLLPIHDPRLPISLHHHVT